MKYDFIFDSILEIDCDSFESYEDYEKAIADRYEREMKFLSKNGYQYFCYRINDKHFCFEKLAYINDVIQFLDIKEGCDLVRFESGNIGYIAYYGKCIDCLELVPITEKDYDLLYNCDSDDIIEEEVKKFFRK